MLKNAILTVTILFLSFSSQVLEADEITEAKILNLIKSDLATIDDHEVTMTKVEMPAGEVIPKHLHPTEEFFYVIKGSTILRLDDKPDQVFAAGSAGTIPSKTPHSAESGPDGMTIMVFRVHPKGEPVRTPVD